MTEEKPKCNVDDLLCQMQVLGHLKGMKNLLGEDKFRISFPEFEGLSGKVSERIESQEASLKEALERCGLPQIETRIVAEEEESILEPEIAEEE